MGRATSWRKAPSVYVHEGMSTRRPRPVTEEERALHDFLIDWVRHALAALRVPRDDLDDEAQEILLKMCAGWESYTGKGVPHAWAWRILRNHLADSGRASKRDPLALADSDHVPDLPGLGGGAEALVAIGELRPVQRRVLWRRLGGYTFKRIAEMEKEMERKAAKGAGSEDDEFATSESSARRVHKEALARLLGDDGKAAAVAPLALLGLLFGVAPGELPETPPDVRERILRNVCARLGSDPPSAMRSDPPSARHPLGPVSSARPGGGSSVVLGSVAGVLAGIASFFILGATLPRCDQERHDGPPPAAMAPPGFAGPTAAPEPASALEPEPAPEPMVARDDGRGRRRRSNRAAADATGEARLILEARGHASPDPALALSELLEARQLYATGALANEREDLIHKVCAAHHDARCPTPQAPPSSSAAVNAPP
jgi:DNA-directed RNA polymerase specialized sigma24 family protein